jgi:hypothetical protein
MPGAEAGEFIHMQLGAEADGARTRQTPFALNGGPTPSEPPAPIGGPIGRLFRPPSHVLVACMPKSGSTFLCDIIAGLPGFRQVDLSPAYGRRQQELDEACLKRSDRFSYVSHNHVQYSDWTGGLCRTYGVTPIVLVRDLLDVTVSLRDHVRNEGPVSPVFFADRRHRELDDTTLERMIVRLALPWYVNFYMSWRQSPDAMLVDYRELTTDPATVAGRVLAFCGAKTSAAAIETAIASVRQAGESRLNVGVSGRGRKLRPEAARAILELLEFYPEAAADPYVRAQTAQARALLSPSQQIASRPVVASRPAKVHPLRRWWWRNGQKLLMRGLVPAAVASLALLYFVWPSDLLPDRSRYGYLDDFLLILLSGVAAGRLTMHKVRGPGRRRTPRAS